MRSRLYRDALYLSSGKRKPTTDGTGTSDPRAVPQGQGAAPQPTAAAPQRGQVPQRGQTEQNNHPSTAAGGRPTSRRGANPNVPTAGNAGAAAPKQTPTVNQTPAPKQTANQTPSTKHTPRPNPTQQDINDMNEIMGITGYTGDPEDIAKAEWERYGVSDAEGYQKVSEYHWRNLVGGAMDTARNTVNDASYRLQSGYADQMAENAVARAMYNGERGTYEELYAKYLAYYQKEAENRTLQKAVDWGEAYNDETERMAQEAGFNDAVRKDAQFYRGIGALFPAVAMSAVGNMAGGAASAVGAYKAARTAAKLGKAFSSSVTFLSASGAAYENEIANGTDPETAMKIATGAGIIELGTEILTSGLGRVGNRVIGTGSITDGLMDNLAAKISTDEEIQKAILYLGGTVGEGFEEYLSEWVNYFANRTLGGSDGRTPAEVSRDAGEAFRDGALVSAIFNTTTLLKKGASPQEAMVVGVEEAAQGIRETAASGRRKGNAAAISETVGTLSDSLRRKLPERDLVQLTETLERSPAGQEYTGILTGLDATDTAAFMEAVTDTVSEAVKRGEGYSSLQDYLTDNRVSQITEAVLETTVEAVNQPDARSAEQPDARSVASEKRKIDHSGIAVLADKAKAAIQERMRNDPVLREAVERAREAGKESFCGVDIDVIIRNVAAGKKMQLPDDNSARIRGNTVIFSGEHGILGLDGAMHSVAVASYDDTRQFNRESGVPGMQAHHIAQNAIYRKMVPKSQGIAATVSGDVFRNPDSQHARLHDFYDNELEKLLAGSGAPRNKEALEIFAHGMQNAGYSPIVIEYAIEQVICQWGVYGVKLDDPIPHIPRRTNYKKSKQEGRYVVEKTERE